MTPTIRAGVILAVVSTTGMIAGCSQLAELQPVAGDQITSVQIATSDVLAAAKVAVKTWPTCSSSGSTYACKGASVAGQTITSTAQGEPLTLQVKLGERVLYTGPLTAVITAAGRQ